MDLRAMKTHTSAFSVKPAMFNIIFYRVNTILQRNSPFKVHKTTAQTTLDNKNTFLAYKA